MIIYTSGDLLKSSADALVNTVNCEGYMGKGIAYQFKVQYPENNKDYVKACKSGKLEIGKLHYFYERGKIIINFPTKDKWRAKSKIDYIDKGLDELVNLIRNLNIKSISIPPLGSGNGGLIWLDVKQVIENKLSILKDIQIYVYEPSNNFISKPVAEPNLSTSALILMKIKNKLNKFDTTRLQKAAYLINIFSNSSYFKFKRYRYGPYDNSIAIISRNIKEFQQYYNLKNTQDAYKILYNKIVSEKVETKLSQLEPFINRACNYVNAVETNHELECLSTILFLIEEQKTLYENEIVKYFKDWSTDKASRFSENDIINGIMRLNESGIIEVTLTGYTIKK
ncbi:macro domain-containing protein [Clostridium butyricum]|nr:macro domain-containing protein [Clostridium butyricum]MDI9208580.1 macro domain-containing protein [Clostridium butyricum]